MLYDVGERLAVVHADVIKHYLRSMAKLVDENRNLNRLFGPYHGRTKAGVDILCKGSLDVARDLVKYRPLDFLSILSERFAKVIEAANADEDFLAEHVDFQDSAEIGSGIVFKFRVHGVSGCVGFI